MSNSEQIDVWSEVCHITINMEGESFNAQMAAVTQQVEVQHGARQSRSNPTTSNVRINQPVPETDTIVRLQAYPLVAGFNETTPPDITDGFLSLLYGTPTIATDGRIEVNPVIARRKLRLVLRWSTQEGIVFAQDTMLGSDNNYRLVFVEGELVSLTQQYIQGVLRVAIELKFPPYDGEGVSNFLFQSTDGSGATPFGVLGAYTTVNKF